MNQLGVDGKIVANELDRSLHSQNVYTQPQNCPVTREKGLLKKNAKEQKEKNQGPANDCGQDGRRSLQSR
jgi:hypothetical protein